MLRTSKKILTTSILSPYQILVLSFASVIFIGTLFLMLPISSANGQSLSLINALFTSTSAVCVTGLSVVDTGHYFSYFGQTILIILIQIGGLGVTTITMIIAVIAGRQIRLKNRLLMQESLNLLTFAGVVRLLISIVIETFIIEFIGGTILAVCFYKDFGIKGIYFGYWHSISAFCNAGFDIFGGSGIYTYIHSPIVTLTLCTLIIIGGIGFGTIEELKQRFWYKTRYRLTLHTKVVLSTTAILLLVGTVFIFILEYNNGSTIGALNPLNKIMASFYLAVTPRTAGFTLLNIGSLGNATLFLIIILMFIGGSPGSTAGGIKTTTFAVIFSSILNIMRGREDLVIFQRRLESDLIMKALALFFVSSAFVVTATMYLCITEHFAFIKILFEVVSAFATVGLSTGITPELSNSGKVVLMVIMLIGRVGASTFTLSLALKRKKTRVHHPFGKISIG
ncbi:TrkH family potassium uptake protein [Pectinatus sottacetonis]|uniref:TrkH family potassium uptake protein n=1 Tax=Pectinatus sottacetonis TaxID=1002795 RepID=UPI0018C5189F|nr:TrkH family potassium uptake protein [Pectinatus sottacetonis]